MGTNVFRPGDRCGGHEVVRLLGSGGFAQVYEVVDETGARRALKTLAAEAEALPKLRARLGQEGAALAMIAHPNVVQLFTAGIHEDRIFLVLELVHGRSLREVMRDDRPDASTLARWIQRACEGLAEAHRVGIVHRDLKPENILIAPPDMVKVIDFGIAKLSSFGVKTTNEQRVGTAMYMSPEQIQGGGPDPRMDVYSMGLVLYEALAGRHPIVTEPATMIEICARQLNFRPPPLLEAAPWIKPELAAVVDWAIAKEKERRPATMRALADALREVVDRPSGALVARPTPESATPVIETSPLGIAKRYGGTQKMPAVAVRPPAHLAKTTPLSPSATFAPTAPLSPSAVFALANATTAPTSTTLDSGSSLRGDTTAPNPMTPAETTTEEAPAASAPVRAPLLPPTRRSRTPLVLILAVAAVGIIAGILFITQIMLAPHGPQPAPSATPPRTGH
ncbi:serine/threonine protein kinase [Minicystis rosea]|nr:serine/threonine protein kinase [Minicystis rosea]